MTIRTMTTRTLIPLLGLLLAVPARAQTTPALPVPPAPLQAPVPALAGGEPLVLDTLGNTVGIAQATAHAKGLQARILWMDAGANVGNLNTAEKIADVVAKTKAAGMNMIVLDVKPIVGETVYPSRFAPKLLGWKGQTVPASFDVLGQMLLAAHAAGLPVYANMSTFGEGHKFVGRGLAYTHPDWQTVLYEANRGVFSGGKFSTIQDTDALPPNEDTLSALTNTALLRKDRPGYTVAVCNFSARVVQVVDGANLKAAKITLPLRGFALIGSGRGGEWLKVNAPTDRILSLVDSPRYERVQAVPEQKFTMFVDPNNPEVRQHEWDMVREVAANYAVDGLVFDDRLRYASVTADFSPRTQAAFEAYVGRKLLWPDDVLKISPYPGQSIIPGPQYQNWLVWRAYVVKSWLDTAARIVRATRPQAQVAVYVGSWYGDYDKVASNWAGPDFGGPWRWLTPQYQKTAYAGTLDWLTTGCYYEDATLAEAVAQNDPPGDTVEGAGQISSRVVDDAAWTYAGLYALSYQGHPEKFARALQAATASTQGVMVFDMSQIIQYDWWHILGEAFAASPAQAPSTVPGLLDQVRRDHAAARAAETPPPPLPPFVGREDTGF